MRRLVRRLSGIISTEFSSWEVLNPSKKCTKGILEAKEAAWAIKAKSIVSCTLAPKAKVEQKKCAAILRRYNHCATLCVKYQDEKRRKITIRTSSLSLFLMFNPSVIWKGSLSQTRWKSRNENALEKNILGRRLQDSCKLLVWQLEVLTINNLVSLNPSSFAPALSFPESFFNLEERHLCWNIN